MANYTLVVVAHEARRKQIERLREQVHPDFTLVDDGTLGVTGNHAAALRAGAGNAHRCGHEWVVVLEDDAEPVIGFHEQLSAALDVAPSELVSLYNGSGHPATRQADFGDLSLRTDVHWILHKNMRHAVGYAVHTSLLALGLDEVMGKAARERWAPDDAMGRFMQRLGKLIAYSNPSCVDHEDGQPMIKTRTSMGHPMICRRRPRRAHWVGTRLHWTDSSVTV